MLFGKKINKYFYCKVVIFLFLLLIATNSVSADSGVPSTISYQGHLSDSGGNLLGGAGTPYYFKFSFWDSPTVGSGTKVWPASAPTATTLTVRQGVFSVNIGDVANGYPDALNYDFNTNKNIYLQVEISSDNSTFETLSPRSSITSSAFSQVADRVSGTSQSSFGTTTPITNSLISAITTGVNQVAMTIKGIASQVANLFNIQDSSGNSLFAVTAGGNVGIGTSTPASKLTVNGTGSFYGGDVNIYSSNQSPTGTGRITWGPTINGGSGALQITSSATGFYGYGMTAHSASAGMTFGARGGSFNVTSDTGTNLTVLTGGNVGIGTTTPQGFLHVYNASSTLATTPKLLIEDQSGVGYPQMFTVKANDNSDPLLVFRRNTTTNGNYEFIVRGGSGFDYMSISSYDQRDNSLILARNGNVGINDTSPDFKFETRGTSTAGYFGVSNLTDGDIFTINTSGNVGIGTTTPSAKLTLSTGAATTKGLVLQGYASQSANLAEFNYDSGTYAQFNNRSGLTIRDVDTTSPYAAAGRPLLSLYGAYGSTIMYGSDIETTNINLVNSTTLYVGRGGGGLNVGSFSGAITSKFGVAGNAVIGSNYNLLSAPTNGLLVEGNVGIGTTTPGSKLDIWGNLNVGTSSTPLFFANTATGRIGIGTTNPTNTLDVFGGARITNGLAVTGGSVDLSQTDVYLNTRVLRSSTSDGMFIGYGGGGGGIHFWPNGGSESMTLSSSGNVGIGTTSPSTKFQVISGDDVQATNIFSAYSNNRAQGFGIGYNVLRQLGTNANIGIDSNGTGWVYLNSSATGGVQIGAATNPNAALRINNTTGASKPVLALQGQASQSGDYISVITSTGGAILNLTGTGNLGIGTSTPAAKLTLLANTGDTNTYILNVSSSTASSANSLFRVRNDGRVFVGLADVTNSASVFNVNGAAYVSSDLVVAGTLYMPTLSAGAGSNLRLATYNQPNVYITGDVSGTYPNLNFGIGTSTPRSTLDVPLITAGQIAYIGSARFASPADQDANGLNSIRFYNAAGTSKGYIGYRQNDVAGIQIAGGNGSDTANLQLGNSSFKINTNGASGVSFVGGDGTGFTFSYGPSSAQKVVFANNGYVGIGTTTPAFPLDVYASTTSDQTYGYLNSSGLIGTSAGTNSYSIRSQGRILAPEFNAVSDARLKNVQFELDPEMALNLVTQLKPVSFKWKNDPDGQPVLGFLAQDVEQIIPNAVSKVATANFSDQRTLDYNQLISVVIGAIKDLAMKVSNISRWFSNGGDQLNIQGEVCVDDVCVTKDQFKQLLIGSGGSASTVEENSNVVVPTETSTTTAEETVSGEASSTPETEVIEPEVISEPEPVAPVNNPEPESEPTTPVDNSAPEPII